MTMQQFSNLHRELYIDCEKKTKIWINRLLHSSCDRNINIKCLVSLICVYLGYLTIKTSYGFIFDRYHYWDYLRTVQRIIRVIVNFYLFFKNIHDQSLFFVFCIKSFSINPFLFLKQY